MIPKFFPGVWIANINLMYRGMSYVSVSIPLALWWFWNHGESRKQLILLYVTKFIIHETSSSTKKQRFIVWCCFFFIIYLKQRFIVWCSCFFYYLFWIKPQTSLVATHVDQYLFERTGSWYQPYVVHFLQGRVRNNRSGPLLLVSILLILVPRSVYACFGCKGVGE